MVLVGHDDEKVRPLRYVCRRRTLADCRRRERGEARQAKELSSILSNHFSRLKDNP